MEISCHWSKRFCSRWISPIVVSALRRYVEAFPARFETEITLLHAVGMGAHNLAEELLPQRHAQLDAFLVDELKYSTTQRLCVTGDPSSEIVMSRGAGLPIWR